MGVMGRMGEVALPDGRGSVPLQVFPLEVGGAAAPPYRGPTAARQHPTGAFLISRRGDFGYAAASTYDAATCSEHLLCGGLISGSGGARAACVPAIA